MLVSTVALPTLAAGQTAPPAPALPIPLVKVEYWHKDQLGSLITTTDHTGAVTARYAYDPFGKRRLANGTWDAAGALVIDWKPTYEEQKGKTGITFTRFRFGMPGHSVEPGYWFVLPEKSFSGAKRLCFDPDLNRCFDVR